MFQVLIPHGDHYIKITYDKKHGTCVEIPKYSKENPPATHSNPMQDFWNAI